MDFQSTENHNFRLAKEMDTPLHVHLDVPAGDLANSRRDAVIGFLKNCGMEESNVMLAIGPNTDLRHPAAQQLSRLNKTETGETAGATPVGESADRGAQMQN